MFAASATASVAAAATTVAPDGNACPSCTAERKCKDEALGQDEDATSTDRLDLKKKLSNVPR